MSETKIIDVVIPAYNAGHTIDKTLMSIAIQSIVDKVCIIIVDDCSNKEHQELYHKYMEMFKPYMRIDYVRLKHNSGPGGARQAGLDFGNSELVTFIDADDVLATSTSLFTLYKDIYNNPTVNYSNSIFQEEVRDNEGNFVGYFDHTNDMTWMFGKIYRRSYLKKYNIHFNNSFSNEDCGFNTLCLLCNDTENSSLYIDRLTYCWNFNENSITKNNDYSFWGLKGYIYNNIWAISEIEDKINDKNLDLNNITTTSRLVNHIVNVLVLCYLYYESLLRDRRNKEQIDLYLSWCVDFYRDIYIRYRNIISQELFVNCYKTMRQSNERLLENWVETISILEFINKLNNLMLDSSNLQTVNVNNEIRYSPKNIKNLDISNVKLNEDLNIYRLSQQDSEYSNDMRYKDFFHFS